MRILPTLAIALAGAAVAAAPAAADSIVYAKQGNLYLTSPDGSTGYQLTFDGGYSEPSQADDGTIGALRYKQLVRLDRSGRLLNAPIGAMGSDGHGAIGGPYEPRISPDGTRFAYYFYVQTSFDDWENDIRWIDTGSYGTWTWADHFTSPATESEHGKLFTQPEWVANDRLLGTEGFWMNMWTWKLGTGHGYTSGAGQWWFGLQDPVDEWGVEPDYVGGQSDLAAPTIECWTGQGRVQNPSWSRDGSLLAYATGDGVHVMTVPADFDCSKLTDRVVAAGASDPAFGPADVDPAQAPSASAPAPAPAPKPAPGAAAGAGASLGALSLRPRVFRWRAGTRVRFTLSAAARVKLTAWRGKRAKASLTVAGKAGANSVRARWRLAPGSYRLAAQAPGTAASASFRVVR